MFKGRIWPIIAIAIGLIIIFFICRASSLFDQAGQDTSLPVDLQNVIPSSWVPLPGQPAICDYDRDGENEWLILFRYDTTKVKALDQSDVQRGPIGGVIYDAQVNVVPQEPGNRSPYRPALIIPYMLLPDFYPGKGQGYLGESNVTLVQYSSAGKRAEGCVVEEIYAFGYADGPLPTNLSAFRWKGKATGYAVAHFTGNARLVSDVPSDGSKPLGQVTTYDRLENHRSLLCEVKRFVRQEEFVDLSFQEDSGAYTIDFCFGAPDDPYYPEGVVVALLRGNQPKNTGDMPEPINESFLMADVIWPDELGNPAETPVRILSIVNQGAVEMVPDEGQLCPNQSAASSAGSASSSDKSLWWCGREEAEVVTEVMASGQPRRAAWRLISIANDQVNADTHWRVSDVELF
jgi:hypothetical protein